MATARSRSCPRATGATLDEIDTPALVVDLDAFEHNLRKLRRLATLPKDATVALCFDSAEQVEAL